MPPPPTTRLVSVAVVTRKTLLSLAVKNHAGGEKWARRLTNHHTLFPPLSSAGNPLASIKQIIFVRHGQHASIMGKQTPCLSQHGMARSLMLAQYLAGKAGAPPGLKAPTLVYAMNG